MWGIAFQPEKTRFELLVQHDECLILGLLHVSRLGRILNSPVVAR